MDFFDRTDAVLWWSSEEVIVPYKHPIDGKYHRYYPDFLVHLKNRDGTVQTLLIEIKPEYQKKEPKVQKRKTKKYINEVFTYAVNQAKWKAASSFCKDRLWEFYVLTEKDLDINQ